jgi:hypothetical protein
VLVAEVIENKEWRTLWGGFVGADLSLGNTGVLSYGSRLHVGHNLSYQLGSVTTIFNPGGSHSGPAPVSNLAIERWLRKGD